MPRNKYAYKPAKEAVLSPKNLVKDCGHNYCELLSVGECCACSDRRPISKEGYRVYVDGKGFVMAADRGAHYCANCKLSERWKPIKPDPYWKPKKCGHNFCQTFGEHACCHCGDLRPGTYFPIYVDGKGWGFMNGAKSMYYCEGCKDPTSEQIVHIFGNAIEPKQVNAALGVKAAPLRQRRVFELKYCEHSPDVPVDCKICNAKGDAESLKNYLRPMGWTDDEITQAIVHHYVEKDDPPTVEELMAILLQHQEELERKRLREPSAPLAEENMEREKEEEKNCMVCMEQTVNCVLIPCGHMGFCFDCGEMMRSSELKACPLCRSEIQMVVKTFKV